MTQLNAKSMKIARVHNRYITVFNSMRLHTKYEDNKDADRHAYSRNPFSTFVVTISNLEQEKAKTIIIGFAA